MWHGIEALIQCIAAVLVLALPFIHYKVANHMHQKLKVQEWRDETGYWLPTILSGVAFIGFSLGCFFNYVNIKWLKIWLAPKVYLLEYLAEMVK